MADDNVFDIGIGTSADIDTLNKALKDIEDKTKESTEKQSKTIENSEKKKEQAVKKGQEKQTQAIKKGGKDSLAEIKKFANSANKALIGIDFSKLMGPMAAGVAIAGIKQVIGALNSWGDAAIAHMKTLEALDAVVKSSGATAWTTSKQLNELATAQSNASGKTRDEITQMQTVLLGFNSVTEDVFKDTTQAAIAMASVMGGGLVGAANTLGKALDVPSQGLTALTRQGFRFTEQQKAMVIELEKAGKLQEAQRVILDSVQSAYGEAGVTTNQAALAQIRYNNAVEDYTRRKGEEFERMTRGWKIAITDYIEKMNEAAKKTKEMKAAIDILSNGDTTSTEYYDASVAVLNEYIDKNKRHITTLKKDIEDAERAGWFGTIIMSQASRELHRQKIEELEEENKAAMARLNLDEKILKIKKTIDSSVQITEKAAEKTNSHEAIEARNKALEAQAKAIEAINNKDGPLLRSMEAQAKVAANIANDEIKRFEKQQEANKIYDENRKALDEEIEKIKRKAELEGKSIDSAEVQKQMLDAETNAYENLLVAAKDYLDMVDDETIFNELKKQWEMYKKLEISENDRKKRLADLAKLQEEVSQKLAKMNEDLMGEARVLNEERIQKEINDLKLKNAKEGIEAQYNYEKIQLDNMYADRINEIDKLYAREINAHNEYIEKIKSDTQLSETEKTELVRKAGDDRQMIEENYQNSIVQLSQNTAEREKQINNEKLAAIEQAERDSLQRRMSMAQQLIDATGSIAGNISTIWTNNIDYDTNEKLRANDKIVQSDEEREKKEKEIMMKAANERYKAELFAWTVNVIMAQATAAMAMLEAYRAGWQAPGAAGGILAGINMALAAAVGTMQVAAVISAQPKPPRFHSGGVVPGRAGQEVPALLKAGETVTTGKQFESVMQAFANVANIKGGGGVTMVQPQVKIENTMSNTASVTTGFDGESLIVKIVEKALSEGRLDGGLSAQQQNMRGIDFQ